MQHVISDRGRALLFTTVFRLALGIPSLLYSRYQGLFPRVQRARRVK